MDGGDPQRACETHDDGVKHQCPSYGRHPVSDEEKVTCFVKPFRQKEGYHRRVRVFESILDVGGIPKQ